MSKAACKAPEPQKLAEPKSSPADAAVDFLKAVDAEGWHNLVRIDPESGETRGQTFAPGSWDAIAAFVDRWHGSHGLYFSTNEPRPHSPDKKLGKRDIGAIRFIFVDKDPDKSIPFVKARAELETFVPQVRESLRPTLTLDSGGGFQFLWRLAEKLDPAEFETVVEEQGRGLAKAFGGDPVQNIDRVLRLPGTINLPNAKKRSRGQTAATARLLDLNDAVFTLAKLAEYAPPQPSPEKSTDTDETVAAAMVEIDMTAARGVVDYGDLPEELRRKFDQALAGNPRLAGIWNGDETCLFGTDRSRSGWRASLAIALARCASLMFSAQDFADLVHAWPEQADALDRIEKRDLARDWGRLAAPIIAERNGYHQKIEETETDWPEPIDIFGDEDPMELGEPPVDALPPIVAQFARSEARRKGVSLAFAASAAIGATAAAIGASLRIQVRQRDTDWTEPAPLWLALVADPGRAKSPTISEATRPLRDLDNELYRNFKMLHDAWAAAQAPKKRGMAPTGVEPIMRRITVDDTTFEKQARIHADNPRGLLRTPDELMGFFGSFGAYKANGDGDRTQMLRLFDGGPIMLDRVGAGSIRAEQALMGIVAGTQPEKIGKIARDLGADGMLQRFLFVLDDGRDREGLDEAPDAQAAASYRALLRELATATYSGAAPVRMSPPAQAAFNEASASIDGLRGLVGMPPAWRGHVQKWGKFLPRLVLTFHCIDMFALYGRVDPTLPIDEMTVARAANFGRFLLRHSLAFYRQNFEPDPTSKEARAFAGYLLTRPDIETVTRRTLGQAQKSLRDDRARVRVMKDLEIAGWLRTGEQGADGPVRCDVNPFVYARFEARAAWERRDREAKRSAIEKSAEAKRWLAADSMSRKSEEKR
jgi:hypothetical protein